MRLDRPAALPVGRLGEFLFPAGDLVYLGSALGPGGLRARLSRHLQGGERPHWHIDRLRQTARVTGFCYTLDPSPLECLWVQRLASPAVAGFPAPGFGASDCRARPTRCPAHLLSFSKPLFIDELSKILAEVSGSTVSGLTFEAQDRG
jgi:Uri superfamily endonuclease